MDTLLPCTFCGGPAKLREAYSVDVAAFERTQIPEHGFRVVCQAPIGCHADSGFWGRTSDAEEAWNRRDPESAIRREVDADESRCAWPVGDHICGQAPDSYRHKHTQDCMPLDHPNMTECHPFTPETTLAAVQRAMKERMSDDACERVTERIVLACEAGRGPDFIADIIKQARGEGA